MVKKIVTTSQFHFLVFDAYFQPGIGLEKMKRLKKQTRGFTIFVHLKNTAGFEQLTVATHGSNKTVVLLIKVSQKPGFC